MKLLQTQRYFPLLLTFIILQPIIDIITFFMIDIFDANITFGIIVRMAFMLGSLVYIIWGNDNPYKRILTAYLFTSFFVLGMSLLASYFYKPTFNLLIEIQWITKISYFLVMFAALFILINSTGIEDVHNRILKSVYIAMTITSVSILIAIFSGTSSNTYDWVLYGYKGWFFSGNELGAIISISFPLVVLYSINKTKTYKDSLYWIPTLLLAITGFLLGTKVGFLSIVMTLVITFIALLIKWISKRKLEPFTFLFSGVILLAVLIFSPFSPGIKNFSVNMPIPEKDNVVDESKHTEDVPDTESNLNEVVIDDSKETPKRETPVILDSNIINKILSSRHFYFTRQYFQFSDANIIQKLFGMGYSGNYTNIVKTIEMDILDVFFSFGILGSLLIFSPLITGLYLTLRQIFHSFVFFLRLDVILLFTSLLLGIGVSVIAGHVLFSPAVSLYFSIPTVFIIVKIATNRQITSIHDSK